MQANCSQCGQKISIDDAKVPDRPFSVKCPKCQTIVKFPGRAHAEAAPEAAAAAPPTPAPAGAPDEMRAQVMAQLRREMIQGEPLAGKALVQLPDRAQAGTLTVALTRLGYTVDSTDDLGDVGRIVEHGTYAMVATTRSAPQAGKGETLQQRIARLNPDSRRRIFLILVGEDLKTGDGNQAFALMADLVVNPKDLTGVDAIVRSAVSERQRLYQTFNEVKARHEAAS